MFSFTEEERDRMLRLRGLFVTRYAAVEWALTRVLIGAYRHPAYFVEGAEISRSFGRRLEQLGHILKRPGPLERFADELDAAFRVCSRFEDDRHFFVHGLLLECPGWAEATCRFVHHDFKGDSLHEGTLHLDLAQLKRLVSELGEAVRPVIAICQRIFRLAGLPEAEKGADFTLPLADRGLLDR